MPANFTRRRDLFLDSGFADPQFELEEILADARRFGFMDEAGEPTSDLQAALNGLAEHLDSSMYVALTPLLTHATEWLLRRGGDLSTLLWMARNVADNCRASHVVYSLIHEFHSQGFSEEARSLLRFFTALSFDYGQLYRQDNIAYGFFKPREPNPFVWKVLKHAFSPDLPEDRRLERLSIMELGCGIGNDAMGFLSHDATTAYLGTDLSGLALTHHEERATDIIGDRPIAHNLEEGDFKATLEKMADQDTDINLIYSYSSLHYFSSEELHEIFRLAHRILPPTKGLMAFAIKGKGSIWDGQGVPIYRPDVWVNHDGQSRWFPSRTSLYSMVDSLGFEVRMHQWYEHWGYSERGELDLFHYMIITPRP